MNQFDALSVADFDGQLVSDVDDVVHEALDDLRRCERVPHTGGDASECM
ncbi:hypothetical protein [Streptomyces cellulosae]|nr:hypothetical protein [Streptomyces cellulosae]